MKNIKEQIALSKKNKRIEFRITDLEDKLFKAEVKALKTNKTKLFQLMIQKYFDGKK